MLKGVPCFVKLTVVAEGARFLGPAEGNTPICKGHGGGKRCQFLRCTKSEHGETLFCVSHGGVKSCTELECTNYCVSDGGGKGASLKDVPRVHKAELIFCSQGASPCDKFDKFTTRKLSLCNIHGAQLEDKPIHENALMDTTAQNPHSCAFAQTEGIFASERNLFDCISTMERGTPIDYGHQLISVPIPRQVGNVCLNNFSLPEGMVHGGLLMEMLSGSTFFGTSNKNQEIGIQLDRKILCPASRFGVSKPVIPLWSFHHSWFVSGFLHFVRVVDKKLLSR